jgi:hypothetical protein
LRGVTRREAGIVLRTPAEGYEERAGQSCAGYAVGNLRRVWANKRTAAPNSIGNTHASIEPAIRGRIEGVRRTRNMQNEGAARQEERELPPLVLLPLLPRCRTERVERTLSPPWERRSSDSGFQSNPAARWHVKRAFCSAPGGIVRGCASSLASDAGIRDWWEGNLYLPLRRLVMRHQQTLGYSWFRGVRHHRMGTPQQWPHDPPREKVVNLTTLICELIKLST